MNRYHAALQPDYLDFLKKNNGLCLCWWESPFWITSKSFYEDLNAIERENDFYGIDVVYIFGIGNGNPRFDLAVEGAISQNSLHHGFFHPAFLPHMQLIGVDGGGNPLVQISRGKHAGKIYLIDHEMYYGGLEQYVDPKKRYDTFPEKFRNVLLEKIDTAELVDELSEWAIGHVADNFAEFFEKTIKHHQNAQARLRPRYYVGK